MKKITVILMLFLSLSFSFDSMAFNAPFTERKCPEAIIVSSEAERNLSDTSMKIEVSCKAAMLMESSSGKVLMAFNEHEKRYPASVTKIMSLILICEAIEEGKISLTDEIAATEEACSKGGSQIWLEPGEMMTVDDLLKATCVFSANDACTLLGETVAGSDEAFVDLMNQKAQELGMNDTHFDNCTGLDDTTTQHLTSAYDIALMSRELLTHSIVKEYSTIYMDTLRNGKTQLVNTNKLVRTYKGITGLKTGTTDKAGCCISATAERDGLSLIAVILGADTGEKRFADAKKMLDWGFANYEFFYPQIEADEIPQVDVIRGISSNIQPEPENLTSFILSRGQKSSIQKQITVEQSVKAPVEKGETLGYIKYTLNGEMLAQYRLCAPEYIAEVRFKDYFERIFSQL